MTISEASAVATVLHAVNGEMHEDQIPRIVEALTLLNHRAGKPLQLAYILPGDRWATRAAEGLVQ